MKKEEEGEREREREREIWGACTCRYKDVYARRCIHIQVLLHAQGERGQEDGPKATTTKANPGERADLG